MAKKAKVKTPRNLVAKYSRHFNRAVVETDRKKSVKKGYRKHKGNDSPFVLS